MTFEIKSPAFGKGQNIPQKYTCDGEDISPPLQWSGAPSGTRSFVLIMDDPDAPGKTWDHWILFNIPPDASNLPEGVTSLPMGTIEGENSWNKTGYGGPCPPDREHRYYFKIYALDTSLTLSRGALKGQIEESMEKNILAKAELIGLYDRPRR